MTRDYDSGTAAIVAERQRQITREGFTADHDASHDDEELTGAAVCYALPAVCRDSLGFRDSGAPILWPWDAASWKPTPGDRIRELAKAGALIAAEIDRLMIAAQEGRKS